MKISNYLLVFVLAFMSMSSCKDQAKTNEVTALYQCPMKCEGDKTYSESESCPVCKMDLLALAQPSALLEEPFRIPETSIFNLTTKWSTEEDETISLIDLKGKPLVMVMIYTTCKAACPRLVADMRNIEKQIPEVKQEDLQYVLISIDPETDTPKRLKEFAIENQMDGKQWTFLQGSVSAVREFANVLAVKYKQISPMDFSHSNIISVFNPKGELVHQQEGLGVDNIETVDHILELLK